MSKQAGIYAQLLVEHYLDPARIREILQEVCEDERMCVSTFGRLPRPYRHYLEEEFRRVGNPDETNAEGP